MTAISTRNARVLVAGILLCAAFALAGASFADAATFAKPAHAGPQEKGPAATAAEKAKAKAAGAGEGIVQSVSTTAIVLRALDGSTVSVPVAPSTHVFVDGKLAVLVDVKPGFVASGAWKTGKPAAVLQAFDLAGLHSVSVGIVTSVSPGLLVVAGAGGDTVSIRLNAATRVI
jgi:hypothetical protein